MEELRDHPGLAILVAIAMAFMLAGLVFACSGAAGLDTLTRV